MRLRRGAFSFCADNAPTLEPSLCYLAGDITDSAKKKLESMRERTKQAHATYAQSKALYFEELMSPLDTLKRRWDKLRSAF